MGVKAQEKRMRREKEERQDKVLFTVNEAAEYLRVHPSTIRNWIKAGKIKYLLIETNSKRKAYRINKDDINKLIKAG